MRTHTAKTEKAHRQRLCWMAELDRFSVRVYPGKSWAGRLITTDLPRNGRRAMPRYPEDTIAGIWEYMEDYLETHGTMVPLVQENTDDA